MSHPLEPYIQRLKSGQALLPDTKNNLLEVVGILKSYAVVLDAYYTNLIYISEQQFLVLFPFFKYFNGAVSAQKLASHLWHDRLNFEYAEYCMRTMLWHGGGGLDKYLDSLEFQQTCQTVIAVKLKYNLPIQLLNHMFPQFLTEQIRLLCYYNALGQFWQVMAPIFHSLSDRFDQGQITSIPAVVAHIKNGLVAAAANPFIYAIKIADQPYHLIPPEAGLTFLADLAIPYVESIFFRGTPFFGTVSYNAQAHLISPDQSCFDYGALYADPLPIGGAGIPPTLLMQDMRHFLPDYLQNIYAHSGRGADDLRVKICESFQKSMFCVTTATILGIAPFPLDSQEPQQITTNQAYLENWMNRFTTSRLSQVQAIA